MTGMHTGHAWIRGNGEIPLRPNDVTVAMLLRDAGYRTAVIGKWGLGMAGTTGQPDKKGFDYSFGFLDHRHAHRQYTDHLYRNAERVAVDLNRDYVNDLFTREAESFITRDDSEAVLPLPQLHRAARRAAGAGRFAGAAQGPLPARDAVRQRGRRRPAGRRDARRRLARLPVAADAARGVRGDDHAHGSRHRAADRPPRRAQDRSATRSSCS